MFLLCSEIFLFLDVWKGQAQALGKIHPCYPGTVLKASYPAWKECYNYPGRQDTVRIRPALS